MPGKKKNRIADQEEVLAVISGIVRGTEQDYVVRKSAAGDEIVPVPPKLSDRMHAAELLAKRYGLTSPQEEVPPGAAAQAIEELLRSLGGEA